MAFSGMSAGEHEKKSKPLKTNLYELGTPVTLIGPERAEIGKSEDWLGRGGKNPHLPSSLETGFFPQSEIKASSGEQASCG